MSLTDIGKIVAAIVIGVALMYAAQWVGIRVQGRLLKAFWRHSVD